MGEKERERELVCGRKREREKLSVGREEEKSAKFKKNSSKKRLKKQ